MSNAILPAKLLILMPWGRVGSNLLVMMMQDSLPEDTVQIANEPFNRIKEADRQSAWLDAHFTKAAADPQLIGCKSSLRATADLARLASDIERLGLSLLRHRRDNLVKVAVSVLRARLYAAQAMEQHDKRKWGVAPGEAPLPPTALDPEQFIAALRKAAWADRKLAAFAPDCPTYDVSYEELQQDPERVTEDVLAWLGLTAAREAHPRFAKATAESLAEAVPNLDQLQAAARQAGLGRFAGMFAA